MRTYPLVLLVPLLSERDDPARGHSAPAVDPAHTLVSHIPCSKAQTGFEHGRITALRDEAWVAASDSCS